MGVSFMDTDCTYLIRYYPIKYSICIHIYLYINTPSSYKKMRGDKKSKDENHLEII